jgi:hypothetical protein
MNLIIMRRGWSVTLISVSAVFVTAILMLLFVPLGRRLVGEGGECAGAAMAVIGSEACVLVAMVSRFNTFPLDARNIKGLTKSVGVGCLVLLVDRRLHGLGMARLAADAVLYATVAIAIGVVRPDDLRRVVRLLRLRGDAGGAPPVEKGV